MGGRDMFRFRMTARRMWGSYRGRSWSLIGWRHQAARAGCLGALLLVLTLAVSPCILAGALVGAVNKAKAGR